MLNTILNTVFNGLLIGASAYTMYSLKPPEHPFAFAASALGFCHGCTGIYEVFFHKSAGSEDSAGKYLNRVKTFTTICMEIVSVPLINMDLYSSSQQTNALALGHGMFIVPLAFNVTYRLWYSGEAEDDATAVLKDLTILGNIVSLLFFSINEDNCPAGIMALSAFFAYYGSLMLDSAFSGTKDNANLAGYALFFGSIPAALKIQ